MKNIKAVALLSGGLDSALAVKLMLDEGIDVVCLNFVTSFCMCDGSKGCKKTAAVVSEQFGAPLKVINVSEEYMGMLKSPVYGYGKNLNPCIDCRIFMMKKAGEFMKQIGAKFIITGEVLGQRPMSQNRKAMEIIEREGSLEDLIVRPLSAQFFPPSLPEREGWVNREKLLGITGRSRKQQYDLTEKLRVSGFACPAGGCLLTDAHFALVAKDLMDSDMLTPANVNLAKRARYFKIARGFKLFVGRNEDENIRLEKSARDGDLLLKTENKGPVAIGRGEATDEMINQALDITAYYCKCDSAEISVRLMPQAAQLKTLRSRLGAEQLAAYKLSADTRSGKIPVKHGLWGLES